MRPLSEGRWDPDRIIYGADTWNTNGDLIADVAELGYIKDDDLVVDITYGRGTWWNRVRPETLVAHDLNVDGVDFRHLPEADASVDVIAFDPPYIPQGGRSAPGSADFRDRYGLDVVPSTTEELLELITDGIDEVYRVLRPGGRCLLKCMNYVNGGRYRSTAYDILRHAEASGLRLVDEFVHVRPPGPAPARRRQLTARRNYSLLYVLRRMHR